MERYQKISSRITILLAFMWLFLPMEVGYKYMCFGALVLYIGIQNMILLIWGQRIGQMPMKIHFLAEKHGNDKAMLIFVLFFVLFFILMGLGIIYSGYQVQFP